MHLSNALEEKVGTWREVSAEAAVGLRSGRHRAVSVDIFRGLNMLLMIFVNNVSEVKGLPWWTYHRGNVDGITYVDMVFPGFLFLMGMAIPLAIDGRVARGESPARIGWHVIVRTASLLALGLFVANALHVDARYTHVSQTCWTVSGFVAIALVWVRVHGESRRKVLHRILRYVGVGILAVLFIVFRKVGPERAPATLDFSYVEILGLLAWAYLLVSGCYLVFARKFEFLVGAFAVMVVMNVFSSAGWLQWMPPWTPFEAGLSSMTMAGVLASMIIVGNETAANLKQKVWWIVGGATLLLAMGFVLEPLGISKNRDTPTWCLYCTAANLAIAMALYWIADVQSRQAWANFAKPVGEHPLLAYLLHYVPFLVLPLVWLSAAGTSGALGVLRSLVATLVVLVLTTALVRFGVRLRV
jgi:heparan-alpha-glucosaminide N-acetyltransferase